MGLLLLLEVLFPVASVDQCDRGLRELIEIVQAAQIDDHLVGSGAWVGKGVNAAVTAELMAGDIFVELIELQIILTAEQAKPILGHALVHGAFFGADRTVAARDLRRIQIGLKSDSTAMAAAVIGLHPRSFMVRVTS